MKTLLKLFCCFCFLSNVFCSDNVIDLGTAGQWTLTGVDRDNVPLSVPGSVPGDVYTDLQQAGVLAGDLFYRYIVKEGKYSSHKPCVKP